MNQSDSIPDYLQDIHFLLKCAFPNGISDEEYWPVLSLLHQVMSFRTIAKVLSVLSNKHRTEVFNDASGYGLDPPPPLEDVERVRQKLNACGYEDWLIKQT
jgi:hypothetical protein